MSQVVQVLPHVVQERPQVLQVRPFLNCPAAVDVSLWLNFQPAHPRLWGLFARAMGRSRSASRSRSSCSSNRRSRRRSSNRRSRRRCSSSSSSSSSSTSHGRKGKRCRRSPSGRRSQSPRSRASSSPADHAIAKAPAVAAAAAVPPLAANLASSTDTRGHGDSSAEAPKGPDKGVITRAAALRVKYLQSKVRLVPGIVGFHPDNRNGDPPQWGTLQGLVSDDIQSRL